MSTELRFLLAIFLVIGVLVGSNMLFPPVRPDPALEADSLAAIPGAVEGGAPEGEVPAGALPADEPGVETAPGTPATDTPTGQTDAAAGVNPGLPTTVPARDLTVVTPLARYTFSTRGASLASVQLPNFPSFAHEGAVELVPSAGIPMLGNRLVVGSDTLDLRNAVFQADASGPEVRLNEGAGARDLTFSYQHPTAPLTFQVTYTVHPDDYLVDVRGTVTGLDRPLVLTDLGSGIALNELRPQDDRQVLAFVVKHTREGIDAERLGRIDEVGFQEGPLEWVAFKSKYFVTAAVVSDLETPTELFGGALVGEVQLEDNASAAFAQSVDAQGGFDYRLYMGPQERSRLVGIGADLENVNPYGWRFLRPIIRPFTGIITWVLNWLHTNLNLAYGWVLIVFGVMMRVVLFPLYHKAMRAQLRNMAVQPKLKEIQARYKDKPEQLQKEMVKLYKEEGFNPLAGCLPMLLPWPILVALFFVFQNTIELRGVPFLWLPDLSAPDPLYLLPVLMGVSMFLLQWISIRSIPDANPQMKMMMWIFPIVFTVMFANFASGLNLYYLTANVAMLPQSWWLAQERKKQNAGRPASSASSGKEGEDGEGAAVTVGAPAGAAAADEDPSVPANVRSGQKKRRKGKGKRRR